MHRQPDVALPPLPANDGRSHGVGRGAAALLANVVAERDRWVLWLPVGLGLGTALYFMLPAEPPLWMAAGPLVFGGGAFVARHLDDRLRTPLTVVMTVVAVVAAGLALARVRTATVAAPVVTARLGPTEVEGRVSGVETLVADRRVTLDRLRIVGLSSERTPAMVRLRVRGVGPTLVPGQRIRVRAVLMPPPAPAAPGAFDFQREAFFDRLGALGFAVGLATVLAGEADDGLWGHWMTAVARLRHSVNALILDALPGVTGAVATAQMTGERGAISEDVLAALRDSGLAHLIAISGLNIGLAAGLLYAGVRGAAALVPAIALRYPIKKWAAVAAFFGAGAYTLLAGATVPTQRAFLMVALVLIAVLVDRRGLSMRTLAWAAVFILVVTPESLVTASFQLSFAAVAALIAVYEEVSLRQRLGSDRRSVGRRVLIYIAGVGATTLIAGMATAPIALYHFSRFAAYGLAANLVAVPITTLWVMPWAVLAFILMPFGLEPLALMPMGWGVDAVIAVAREVASWPGAVSLLPGLPVWGLAAFALGGLWLCLWRRRWRWIGVLGIAGGLVSLTVSSPPDVLVNGDGTLMAVRAADGGLVVSPERTAAYTRRAWLQRSGTADAALAWPVDGVSADGRLTCDALGCLYRAVGRVAALVRREEALTEDCRVADVVVAVVPVRKRCPAAVAVIDRFDLWRNGGHAVWLTADDVRIDSVNGHRGDRPWVVRPEPRRRRSSQDGHAGG